jgi:hypothetical protein
MTEIVAVDLTWVVAVKNILTTVYSNVREVEINTYEVNKAERLLFSMQGIENVISSLNRVISISKKYTIKI